MSDTTYTTKFTNEYVNDKLKHEDEQYKKSTAEDIPLIDEALKSVYKEYYPEIVHDEKLFKDIKNVEAEVFFLRLCVMQDKLKTDFSYDLSKINMDKKSIKDSVMHEDKSLKYPDMLTSAKDMLTIFSTVIFNADKELKDAMLSDDMARLMSAYENPLCQNAAMFITNETTIENIEDIQRICKSTSASMNILNAIIDNSPEIQQMIGDMRAHANLKYAESGLTPHFSRDDTASAEHLEIKEFIDTHPKTVLALAILAEQRKGQGVPVERIDSVEALMDRCEKADVKAMTKTLSYTDSHKNISSATLLAEKYVVAEKSARGKSRTA